MSFRARLLIALVIVVLLPLSLLALGVRNEMRVRVIGQSERRVQALAAVVEQDLDETHAAIGAALRVIASALPEDPQFRAGALRGDGGDRSYLLDYAGRAMRATGLSMLQIRNDSGRIMSSGHFPEEFDRVDAELPRTLLLNRRLTLVSTRTAEGTLATFAAVDTVSIGGRTFSVIGGRIVDERFANRLARGDEIGVMVRLPDSTIRSTGVGPPNGRDLPPDRAVVTIVEVGYIDATRDPIVHRPAEVVIARSPGDADALRRSVDRWILAAFLLATVASVLVAMWISARLSRPMEELARATAAVDLDRLDVRFATGRGDEIGVLSRRLASMVERLRGSAARLRDAERRATVGEMARQVNHDIKNGLAPIRNVVRHLAQVAREEPGELPGIFTARQGTLESSISYLETLAQNYARLTPSLVTAPSEVGAVIDEVVRNSGGRGASVRARVAPGVGRVQADAIVLRRIIENLVGNAIDSLDGKVGEVTVSADPGNDPRGQPIVTILVADTGRGMTERELARAFDDFYTTKPNGTGLGLSVVRRLVADLGGSLRVETEPGRGTKISVVLPTAAAGAELKPASSRT